MNKSKERWSRRGRSNRPALVYRRDSGGLAPPVDDSPSIGDWTVPLVCLGLVILVYLIFGRTLAYGFVNYDDNFYVYDNPAVQVGLTWHGLATAFTHSDLYLWTPLTRISHMLAVELFSLDASGHHFVNTVLHCASSILLFLLLRKMTGDLWPSAFVAAVFAIHPLHVESVAWISGRKDVLSGLFFMLTLFAYQRFASKPGSSIPYLLALVFFLLGLLSKPMLVPLPLILLLLDYWPLKRFGWPPEAADLESSDRPLAPSVARIILEKIPFLLLSLASAGLSLFDPFGWDKNRPPFLVYPFALRIKHTVVSYVEYLIQMVWPGELAVHYPFVVPSHLKFGICLALLVVITVGAWLVRKKYPYLIVGWVWYLAMVFPVIGIIEPGGEVHSDRYTYLSQIGLYVLATWTLADLSRLWLHRSAILATAGSLIILTLTGLAFVQTSYWQNSERLWSHALWVTANNDVAEAHLGLVLATNGRSDEAIAHVQEALRINSINEDAHCILGGIYGRRGRLVEASEQLRIALSLNPNDAAALNNLGNVLLDQGQFERAAGEFKKTIELNPRHRTAYQNLGSALFRMGEIDQAIVYYKKQIEIQPNSIDCHFNLANAYVKTGQLAEAIAHYRRVVAIKPDYPDGECELAKTLSLSGQKAEAARHFAKAAAFGCTPKL